MTYSPNLFNPNEPVIGNVAGTAAEEFRLIKTGGMFLAKSAEWVDYSNTTSFQFPLDYNVVAGYLGTTRTLRLEAYGRMHNTSGGNVTYAFYVQLGGTNVFIPSFIASTGTDDAWMLSADIKNNNAGSQSARCALDVYGPPSSAGALQNINTQVGAVNVVTLNTAVDQLFRFSMQMNVASANASFTLYGARLLIG
jgi:hypothetical protein